MAGKKPNVYNDNDSMDINELAALNNEDFSPEMIEQLQKKVYEDAKVLGTDMEPPVFNAQDDSTLFEETPAETEEQKSEPGTQDGENAAGNNDAPAAETSENESQEENSQASDASENQADNKAENQAGNGESPVKDASESSKINLSSDFDVNFIKKYKAKLDKQKKQEPGETTTENPSAGASASVTNNQSEINIATESKNTSIESVTQGKITEQELTEDKMQYRDALDVLDGNVKYSKYVIYIDPQNVDFMETLTVKERKNLINKVISDQGNVLNIKNRFKIIQTILLHSVISIIIFAISVPVVYYVVNASLEATINNYRRSQSNFQVLYREKGKIKDLKK